MKWKLGAITIGQSPRDDVIPEMIEFLGEDVEVVQAGALDDLTLEEIQSFTPEEGDYILVSKLRDGSSVRFSEKYILPKLQESIDKLEEKHVDIILFLCTGVFPDIFKSSVPIIYPQDIIYNIVLNLVAKGKLGVVTPDPSQIKQNMERWKDSKVDVEFFAASPYSQEDEIQDLLPILEKSDRDIIFLDCMGYTMDMKKRIVEDSGKMVILSRSLVARVLGEILS